MVRPPPKKLESPPQLDPKRGDEILKHMLRSKPKQHKEMVAERKTKRDPKDKKS
jgi:hypothetical protein